MRVAFLGNRYLDPDNCGSWSGLPYFMRRALEGAGIETVTIAPQDGDDPRRLVRFLYWRWFHGKRYLKYCDERLLQSHARQCERRLAALTVDGIFSPSTWPFAYLESGLPTVFWTDASFAGVLDFYESFTNVVPSSIAAGHAVEQRALDRCARAIFSSDWAADSARLHYRVNPAKTCVVPFGANLQEPPKLEDVREMVRQRPMRPCRLLLVGVEWQRKGVDLAIQAATLLDAAGIECTLTIVGCSPPVGQTYPRFVEIIPFIRKRTSEDRRRLNELYARSHFFIMPSRAEAFGIVFAEASTFGVPCLAAQVGGLSSVILTGVNGELFPLAAGGEAYADWIRETIADEGRYRALAIRAAEDAATRLSWDVVGRRVAQIFTDAAEERARLAPAVEPAIS
jgi:glycosyltransferase involved in cell wall biosynthesis